MTENNYRLGLHINFKTFNSYCHVGFFQQAKTIYFYKGRKIEAIYFYMGKKGF